MAEVPFFSSQGSEYNLNSEITGQENADVLSNQRPKKAPTVTPKRFKKFFTPRASIVSVNKRQSKAGRQLRDITKNGANRRRNANPPLDQEVNETDIRERPPKRRKCSIDFSSSPLRSSPLKHMQTVSSINVFQDCPTSPATSETDTLSDLMESLEPFPEPIRRISHTSVNRRVLQRTFGGYNALSRGRRAPDHCADWRAETANFVSTPSDAHRFGASALPFCIAGCNTNSLVAVGDEEGGVRLIDTLSACDFSTPHLTFRPHHNAIMDIAFSSDDYMLATASGDQTARIVDMHTQQTMCILSGHKSSLKQIRFQPSDDNMITTSSRDGSVMLWDMRCGGKGSVAALRPAVARNWEHGVSEPTVRYSKWALNVGSAHRAAKSGLVRSASNENYDMAGVSITAMEHMRNGREHLLLTTSELDSAIKLWDLRSLGRRSSQALLSSTPPPTSHSKIRNYGLNAIALSGDGARLYGACRDGIVYAYSTNHLILGNSLDTQTTSGSKGRDPRTADRGIGPLYGFRHPALRLGSFYVRAKLRPIGPDKTEMLALGSSNNCALLLPTDERHLQGRIRLDHERENDANVPLPSLISSKGSSYTSHDLHGIPIYEHGTALIRGHHKEVTSLAWSHDGDLVTLGDDFTARCWRDNGAEARRLRACGEGGGERWNCGWADVEASWDEDDN